MHWLEARFRRKFEPHGDEFLFRQVDRDVIFDREDVEFLVADWRRYWFSPLLWSAVLLLGVAPLIAMRLWTIEGYEAFFIIVPTVVLISCPVVLWTGWRLPDEAAFKLKSVGPGRGRSAYASDIFWIVLTIFWLSRVQPDEFLGNWGYLIWGAALLYFSARLVRTLWKRRREIGGPASKSP